MHTRKSFEPCKIERRVGRSGRQPARAPAPAVMTFAASLSLGASAAAMASPTGGVVTQGQGRISTPAAGQTLVNQSSQQLNLNWSTFNVAANESVRFNQPSSTAVAFNRILDQSPSQIFGTISANGQVVLVNPNGLLIGRTAQLNVGSLVVSSLNAIDFDPTSGRYRFSATNRDPGAVVNQGTITAQRGGSVTLLGGSVSNSGTIVADYGTVNLAAGRTATLDLAGDGLLRLEVGSDLLTNHDGVASAVDNSGSIQAGGGQVFLTASAVQNVFQSLVNNTGVIRANRINNSGGTIELLGPGGTVESSGTLDASAGDGASIGGTVEVLGNHVGLMDNAVVNVSGATGGGTALIGGDTHGANPDVLDASMAYVSPGATINADAGEQGDGGRVVVWSNEYTAYHGGISARGGALWGSGGSAEVSSKGLLQFDGTANLTAPKGLWGTLLLDPADIQIDDSGTQPASGWPSSAPFTYTATTNGTTIIGASQIVTLLGQGNVTLATADGSITEPTGLNATNATIDVSQVSGDAGHTLTFNAGADITLNYPIATNNANIKMSAGGNFSMASPASLSAGTGTVTVNADGTATVTNVAAKTININSAVGGGSTGALTVGEGSSGISGTDVTLNSNSSPVVWTAAGTTSPVSATNSLTLTGLSIGTALTPILTNVGTSGNLSVTGAGSGTVHGDVYVLQSSGDLTVSSAAANNGGFLDLATQSGSLTTTGAVSGTGVSLIVDDTGTGSGHELMVGGDVNGGSGPVTLQTASGGEGITLGASGSPVTITTTGSATLSAGLTGNYGALSLGDPGDTVSAPHAFITAQSIGTSAHKLLLQAASLQATGANGGIYIQNSDASAFSLQAIATNGPVVVTNTSSALNVTDASGAGVTLTTQGSSNDINITTAGVNGNNSDVTLSASGNLTLSAPVTAAGALVTLNGAAITMAGSADAITAGNLAVQGASIGTAGNPLYTALASTGSITNATSSAGSIFITQSSGDLTVASATATGGSAQIETNNGNLKTTGQVKGGGVTLIADATGTGSGHSLSIGGNVVGGAGAVILEGLTAGEGVNLGSAGNPVSIGTTGNVTISAGTGAPGNIGILNVGDPNVSVSGNQVTLTGQSVGISAGQPLLLDASSLLATSTNGGIFVQNTNGAGPLGLQANATNGAVDVTTTNDTLNVTSVSGNGVSLTTQGTSHHLNIGNGATVNANGGALSLSAQGANSSINATGTLTAAGGIITLQADGSGGTVNLGSSISNVSSVTVAATGANGAINLTAPVQTLGGGVTMDAAGALSLGGFIFTPGGAVTLTGGAITMPDVSDVITASSLTATGSSIGTSSAPLYTDVGTIVDVASSAGGAFLNQTTGGLSLAAASANGGLLQIETQTGDLTTNGAVSGSSGVSLLTDLTGHTLTINGTVTGGTGPVSLLAKGDGDGIVLNNSVGTSGDVTITAGSVASQGGLTLGSGASVAGNNVAVTAQSIGASASTPLLLSANQLVAKSTSGGIFVQNTNSTGPLTLTATAAGGPVDVTTTNDALAVTSVSGSGVVLVTQGSANDLTINGVINGNAGAVALTASGAITAGNTSEQITGSSLQIAGASMGMIASPLLTNVPLLTLNNPGDTTIYQLPGTDLSVSGSSSGAVSIETGSGTLTETGLSGAGVRLSADGANNTLTLTGVVNGNFGAVLLQAPGDGGNVVLNNSVSTVGTLDITAGSVTTAGTLTLGGGASIAAGAASIYATSIGASSSSPLVLSATSLNATSPSGGIFIDSTGSNLALTAQTSGTVFAEAPNGTLTVASVSGGNDISLSAGSGMAVNGPITTPGNVSLDGSSGAITAGLNGLISAAALTAHGTSIGAAGADLTTSATSVTATGTGGGVYISGTNTNGMSLNASATGQLDAMTPNGPLTVVSATGNGVTLVSGGIGQDFTLTGGVDGGAGGISLTTTGAGSNININAAISAATDVTLNSSGAGGSINLSAPVTAAGTVTLTAGTPANGGAITPASGATITANALTASGATIGSPSVALSTSVNTLNSTSTNGATYISNVGALALTASATGGLLDVMAGGPLTVTSATGDSGITLGSTGNNSAIAVYGAVAGGAGPVSLDTFGPGGAINLDALVSTAGTVTLAAGPAGSAGAITAGSGEQITANTLVASGASIGASSAPLVTTVRNVNAASSNGDTVISNSGALSLQGSASGGQLAVTTSGPLTVALASGDTNVSLAATGSNEAIKLSGPILANGTVTLAAGTTANAGAITAATGEQITANTLLATGANIGAAGAPLGVTVTHMNATSSNGGVFVSDSEGLELAASATGGPVSVTASGPLAALPGGTIAGDSVFLHATSIGTNGTPLTTATASLNAISTAGAIYVQQAGPLNLTADATGGSLNVATTGGALTVLSATGSGVTLAADGSGENLNLNGALNGGTGPVTLTAGGAIVAGAGEQITGGSLSATGTSIGTTSNPLDTSVGSLASTSTNGGTYINETDSLTLTASATGGPLNVQTIDGAIAVSGANAPTISLNAGGAGSGITLNGVVSAGSTGDVNLVAGTTASPGAISAGSGSEVVGATLTAQGAAIGSSASPLSMSVGTLSANAMTGDAYVNQQGNLKLADVRAAGNLGITAGTGDLRVDTVVAGNNASLTASSGTITDDPSGAAQLSANTLTLVAQSIGAPATLSGTTLDTKPRLDTDVTNLVATSSNGGVYINQVGGLASANVHATGKNGNVELLTGTGDINISGMGASGTLLLAAGGNIYVLPNAGTITAQAAELRAGAADLNAGHIGTLSRPLVLQLNAGNTLRMFVPQTIDPNDANSGPATLTSPGVQSTLSLFTAPSALAVEDGFGQFQGLGETQFTSQAQLLVRSIQNQTATVQSVVGLDWASFDPNVSLFGKLDPSVCLPGDQRDEEAGAPGTADKCVAK